MMPRDFWERRARGTLILGSPWEEGLEAEGSCVPAWFPRMLLVTGLSPEGLPLWQLACLPSHWKEGPAEAGSPADCTALRDLGLRRGECSAFLASGALEK